MSAEVVVCVIEDAVLRREITRIVHDILSCWCTVEHGESEGEGGASEP